MTENLIIVFTRNPELGKCKTRLAKTVGNENALIIYKLLLNHTSEVLEQIPCDKAIYYSVKVRKNDMWNDHNYQKLQQYGDDLGERMYNAFKDSFKRGYKKVIIVGSDLYDLKANHITEAIEKLNTNDIVIGPAEDGGYYLLGMKTLEKDIFENKEWGTNTVRKDTLRDLENKTVFQLETLNDIDIYDDVKDYDIFKPYLINNTTS
jgi:hypothetical protein